MDFAPVLTKANFVRRYEAGEFGNRSPTWNGIKDWLLANEDVKGDHLDKFHIRNRIAGAMTWYDVPRYRLEDTWKVAIEHFRPEELYISEMAPTHLTLFQGEVEYSERGLSLYGSAVKKPMRQSLIEGGDQYYGLAAKLLLDRFLNPLSRDWLDILFQRYPYHVVEFSSYSRCWGTIPNMNTVIWEVRKY